ncbi:hypothetical protein [Bartonella sp. DGB2]|uniref:hypothetical protein n=1 Tax=Bartonella sp. DGB2 TaxID=3388426 RepID=UPI00398FF5A1
MNDLKEQNLDIEGKDLDEKDKKLAYLESLSPEEFFPKPDPKKLFQEILREKMRYAMIPGFMVQCTPEEADALGAIEDDAMTHEEALEGSIDLLDYQKNEPFFDNSEDPSDDIPTFITRKSVTDTYRMKKD